MVLIQNDAPWVFEQIETNSAHMLLQQFLSISVPPLPSGRVVMIFSVKWPQDKTTDFTARFLMPCTAMVS